MFHHQADLKFLTGVAAYIDGKDQTRTGHTQRSKVATWEEVEF